MVKRVASLALAACFLLLSGCADYRGLNELTIIAGIAVDLDESGDGMVVTFEYVDISTESDSQYSSSLLITEGATLAEAVYDANTKLHSNMYLGNAEVVIISSRLAEEKGIHSVLDYLLRSEDTRDNLHIVVATTETAGELLAPTEDQENGILSFRLSETLDQHEGNNTISTNALEAFEIYNILELGTSSLALPIITTTEEGDQPFQFQGMALFTKDKMTGELAEEDMSFYLLAVQTLSGSGGYPVETVGETDRSVVIANRRSRPSKSVSYQDGNLSFLVKIRMTADVVEFSSGWEVVDTPVIHELEQEINGSLSASVEEVVVALRDEGYDVLGLSETLRNHDYELWCAMEEHSQDWLLESEISVQMGVRIDNTGMIEQYGGTET